MKRSLAQGSDNARRQPATYPQFADQAGSFLLTNIAELVTNSPDDRWVVGELAVRRNAALVIENGRVAWVGRADAAPAADRQFDVSRRAVLPGFVDSHAHLVFAGDRSAEFAARMAGQSYSAGGIAATVSATRAADDAALRANTARLVAELTSAGATTYEIKSGYGLTIPDEARALRIAREFSEHTTFLGAHVVPAEYADDRDGYLSLLAGPMLAECRPWAKYLDVFCDQGAFDAAEASLVLGAGLAAGLIPRVHANQLTEGPGVGVALAAQAASADHCTHLSSDDIGQLGSAAPRPGRPGTVATLLPAADFATRSPYPPARALLTAGAVLALATDCNPGTSYTTSLPFCIALAVREMRMTPAEAVWAATRGGALALRRPDLGRLVEGGPADLIVLDAPSHVHLAYRPGVDLISAVYRAGQLVHGRADG
ncbi:MAG: imidazolonepropionase [Candidatus Nanopelagicales bacterium]